MIESGFDELGMSLNCLLKVDFVVKVSVSIFGTRIDGILWDWYLLNSHYQVQSGSCFSKLGVPLDYRQNGHRGRGLYELINK